MGRPIVMSLAVSGSYVFAGTNGAGVYRSSDSGLSWAPANEGLTNNAIWSLAVSGTYLYAGVTGGIFRSTDNAASWMQVENGVTVLRVAANNSCVIARFGPNAGTLYLSTDHGTSWRDLNSETLWDDAWNVYIHNGYVFTAAWGKGSGVWRCRLDELVSCDQSQPAIPGGFLLQQNYPNPFNPVTHIRYQISDLRYVKLTVYDLLGREVAVLVDEEKPPGSYDVQFSAKGGSASGRDASGLSSGVYFYRLQAADFTQTKRLLLLR
jgi:hypothetical protein